MSKFNISASVKPAEKPVEAKKTVMTDSQFAEFVDGLEVFMDSYAAGVDATEAEAFANLESFADFMGTASDDELKSAIAAEEELSAMFDGSLENFKTLVNANIAAQEGMLRDWYSMYFGGLITAFIKRNNHTVAYLKPALEQLEEKLPGVPEKRFAIRIFRMNIASKYLPSFDQFGKASASFQALAAYIKSAKPESWDPAKADACLKGSLYEGMKDKSSGSILFGLTLPAFAVTYENADVRQRGWSSAAAFKTGLDESKKLVATIEDITKTIAALKTSVKGEENADVKKNLKQMVKAAKFVAKEAGFMCRGFVVAGKKITSGFLGRLAQGLVD